MCRCICGCIWVYIGCSRGVARDVFGVREKRHQGGRRPAALCKRYKLGRGNIGYTPDTCDASQIHTKSTPAPCIQPRFILDTPDTGRQQGDQRSPALLKGVSMLYPGMYLRCIWGASRVYPVYLGCIQGVSSVPGEYPVYTQTLTIIINY